jgi:hypothetical protein
MSLQVIEAPSHAIDQNEFETPHVEVQAQTIDDLVLLRMALGDYIDIQEHSDNPNTSKLEHAEELKNQVAAELNDDTTDIELPRIYVIEEKDFVTEALGLLKTRERDDEVVITPDTQYDYDWLSNPNAASKPDMVAKLGRTATSRERQIMQGDVEDRGRIYG